MVSPGSTTHDDLREHWEVGQTAWFEYHCLRAHDSGDAEAWYRDHQEVTVIGEPDSDGKAMMQAGATQEERSEAGCPMVYRVRFADGHEHDVFEDELLTDPSFFDPKLSPPPQEEIDRARARRRLADWPIFERSEPTFHVGDLERPNSTIRHSLEGAGLSVSDHPEEWTAIAKLGGGKTYTLAKPGARFLDMLALARDERLMSTVRDWGLARGLIEPATLYRVSRFDDELDREIHSLLTSAEDAEAEAEEGGRVEVVAGFLATERLARLQRQPSIDPLCVDDMLTLAYAQYELKLDGAWWFEELDELALSAPRGVIFEPTRGWEIRYQGNAENLLHLNGRSSIDIVL